MEQLLGELGTAQTYIPTQVVVASSYFLLPRHFLPCCHSLPMVIW